MDHTDSIAEAFEAHRAHLQAVAFRMLGSNTEADDAVQEAWLRLHRSGDSEITNFGGWLTTVVSRVCLDMLRTRKSRREDPLDHEQVVRIAGSAGGDPEDEAMLADSLGPAMLVVLETLSPAERLAFVLHDMFAVPFEEIATIIDRSPAASRQLASRARRRVQGSDSPTPNPARQREVVEAFLAASRDGDLERLVALLDPDVVLRADDAAVSAGASAEARGAAAVAATFSGRAQGARLASIDGRPGAVWTPGGRPRVVFSFTVAAGTIREIELIADAARLADLDLAIIHPGA